MLRELMTSQQLSRYAEFPILFHVFNTNFKLPLSQPHRINRDTCKVSKSKKETNTDFIKSQQNYSCTQSHNI